MNRPPVKSLIKIFTRGSYACERGGRGIDHADNAHQRGGHVLRDLISAARADFSELEGNVARGAGSPAVHADGGHSETVGRRAALEIERCARAAGRRYRRPCARVVREATHVAGGRARRVRLGNARKRSARAPGRGAPTCARLGRARRRCSRPAFAARLDLDVEARVTDADSVEARTPQSGHRRVVIALGVEAARGDLWHGRNRKPADIGSRTRGFARIRFALQRLRGLAFGNAASSSTRTVRNRCVGVGSTVTISIAAEPRVVAVENRRDLGVAAPASETDGHRKTSKARKKCNDSHEGQGPGGVEIAHKKIEQANEPFAPARGPLRRELCVFAGRSLRP